MLRKDTRARIAATVSRSHWGGAYCANELCSRIDAGELKIEHITVLDRLLFALTKEGQEDTSFDWLTVSRLNGRSGISFSPGVACGFSSKPAR